MAACSEQTHEACAPRCATVSHLDGLASGCSFKHPSPLHELWQAVQTRMSWTSTTRPNLSLHRLAASRAVLNLKLVMLKQWELTGCADSTCCPSSLLALLASA